MHPVNTPEYALLELQFMRAMVAHDMHYNEHLRHRHQLVQHIFEDLRIRYIAVELVQNEINLQEHHKKVIRDNIMYLIITWEHARMLREKILARARTRAYLCACAGGQTGATA